MKDAGHNFSARSLLALILVLGLTYLVLDFSGRLYYGPLCRRYGHARGLTYAGHTIGYRSRRPAQCFFRDARGNMKSVEAPDIPAAPGDWGRWVLRWAATILGVGGSVWLASLVGGFKVGRRRR